MIIRKQKNSFIGNSAIIGAISFGLVATGLANPEVQPQTQAPLQKEGVAVLVAVDSTKSFQDYFDVAKKTTVRFKTDLIKSKSDVMEVIKYDGDMMKPLYEASSRYSKTSTLKNILDTEIVVNLTAWGTPEYTPLAYSLGFSQRYSTKRVVIVILTDGYNETLRLKGKTNKNSDLENLDDTKLAKFVVDFKQVAPDGILVMPFLDPKVRNGLVSKLSGLPSLVLGANNEQVPNRPMQITKTVKELLDK